METPITENQTLDPHQAVNEMYNHAAELLFVQKKPSHEVRNTLMEKGLSENAAYTIVTNLEEELRKARKEQAVKDMIFGALWCIGGTIATLANIGFIFWGAILFGGIQFLKGLFNSITMK